jgi:AraC-like DNA-binding protein
MDMVFLHSGHTPRCTAVVNKHFVDYCSLQLMTGGGIEFCCDEARWALRGRWLWSCCPGPLIRFHLLPGQRYWVHRYAAFRGTLVNAWIDAGLLPVMPQRPPGRDTVRRFDAMLELVRRGDRWGRLRASNLLECLLLELAEARGRESTAWLDEVRESLVRQGSFWPDYYALARETRMALSTLRRRFRQEAGVSLHRHALQRRMSAAREMLGNTALPIKTIAGRLGYRDIYFFSRQFRELIGAPPAAYRRSKQG